MAVTIPRGVRTRNYATGAQTLISPQSEVLITDAIKMLTRWELTPNHNAEIREDYHPETRDPVEEIPLDKGPHDVSGECYLLGANTQGDPPDLTGVYASAFSESQFVATTQDGAGADTATVEVLGTAATAGQIIKVVGTAATGADEYRYAQVYAVALKVHTIWPPLATALAASDDVDAVCNYELENNNTKVITLYTTDADNLHGIEGIAATISKYDFTFSRGAPAKLALTGQCAEIKRVFATTLDTTVNDSVTTVILVDPSCESGAVVQCESELILLGETTDNLTFTDCTRSFGVGAAAAHTAAVAVTPNTILETTVGSPIRGYTSHSGVWLGSSAATANTICVPDDMDITVSIDEKHALRGCFGDGGTVQAKVNEENREVSISFDGYLDKELAEQIITMVDAGALRVFIQVGHADGRSFAMGMPKVNFNPPTIADVGGSRVHVKMESRAVLYDSTNSLNAITFCY